MSQRVLRGLHDKFGLHIGLAVGNVVAHRVVEENSLLRHLRYLPAQRAERQIAKVEAVNENAARSDVKEARNQVGQGGLAGSAGADQRQHFAGPHLQVDVVQNLVLAFFRRVGKAHIFKADVALEFLQRDSVRPLLHVVLGVKEAEDRNGCTHGLLEAVVEVGELAHRIVELEEQDNKCAEESHGHAAVHDFGAADEQEHGNGDGTDGIHQRRTDRLDAHAPQVGAEEAAGCGLEAQDFPHLSVEGLYDAVAGDGLMQNILYFGELVLAGASAGADLAANLTRGCNNHRHKQQQRPAQCPTEFDHEE